MIVALLLAAALLHPVHETVSELEWNVKTKRLEVAIRFDPLDEQWLKSQEGPDEDLSKWALGYLRRNFRIADESDPAQSASGAQPAKKVKYHWVGRDDKKSHVWWYFELEPADGQRPSWIDQQILFERNENYVNRILILGQVPRRALTLTIERPRAYLDRDEDEQAQERKPDSRSSLDRR